MKKILFPVFIMVLICLNSCNYLKFEAYVTIVNIGSLEILASVDDDEQRIDPFSSQTWSIKLESENEIVDVDLYAEPVIGGDHDSATATLHGDRDIETWLVGWDAAAARGKLQKKKSSFLPATDGRLSTGTK